MTDGGFHGQVSNSHIRLGVSERNHYGESVSSGLYFYRLDAGDFMATRRMLLVK